MHHSGKLHSLWDARGGAGDKGQEILLLLSLPDSLIRHFPELLLFLGTVNTNSQRWETHFSQIHQSEVQKEALTCQKGMKKNLIILTTGRQGLITSLKGTVLHSTLMLLHGSIANRPSTSAEGKGL